MGLELTCCDPAALVPIGGQSDTARQGHALQPTRSAASSGHPLGVEGLYPNPFIVQQSLSCLIKDSFRREGYKDRIQDIPIYEGNRPLQWVNNPQPHRHIQSITALWAHHACPNSICMSRSAERLGASRPKHLIRVSRTIAGFGCINASDVSPPAHKKFQGKVSLSNGRLNLTNIIQPGPPLLKSRERKRSNPAW